MKDRQETKNLEEKITTEILRLSIQNINQRRELLKHLTLISAGILGFTPILFDKATVAYLLIVGASAHLITILLILWWLESILEREGEDLTLQMREYQGPLNKKVDILDKYLGLSELDATSVNNYLNELRALPEITAFREKAFATKDKRVPKDRFTTLILGLFSIASICVLFSLIKF